VDVWVLNRSPSTFQVSQSKLLETFDLRNDRLGLGDRIQRNPGFEIANENPKLVILGKPGAGKTTFLKHLAVDWGKGQFQPDLITVLIEFRQIQAEQWHLIEAISKGLGLSDGHQITAIKKQIEELKRKIVAPEQAQQKNKQIKGLQKQLDHFPLQVLLTEGKLLVLMDGLDEVPTNALRGEVQRQLCTVTEEYPKNRFVLTCRTQIITSIPIGFASVEVADFSPEQVQQFVKNWFMANGKPNPEAAGQWKTLSNLANKNPPLKELTTTPVLLSLMCLVLHDEGEIPSEINGLYKKGIKLLLSKWNEAKQINGWQVGSKTYRRLSIRQKEKLLIEIAGWKFDNPKNFVLFEQEEIVDYIGEFLQRTVLYKKIFKSLQVIGSKTTDSEENIAVLKSIEAQHGLLIERADGLWSFSHLTFQEYFTIQWLTQLSPEELTKTISNPQRQDIVKQLIKSQQPADRLLRLIKQAIDRLIAHEAIANQFLTWVLQKAQSIQARYKLAAIKAFYFALALNRSRTLVLNRAHALDRALDFDLDFDLDLDLDLDFDLALDLTLDHTLVLALDPALDRALDRSLDRSLDRALDCARTLDRMSTSKLVDELEELRAALPTDSRQVLQWWKTRGMQWTRKLRQVMIEQRNIGHEWRFTDVQKKQLQNYYQANKILVELMNIEGAISDDVRAEIEDTLLLP